MPEGLIYADQEKPVTFSRPTPLVYVPMRLIHARPVDQKHPDLPPCDDPGRPERLRLKAGNLIQKEILAAREDMKGQARAQARRAIVGTPGGAAAGRKTVSVPTEEAGVYREEVQAPTPLDQYHVEKELTPRQWEAGDKLRRDWKAAQISTAAPVEPGAADYSPRSSRGEPCFSKEELERAGKRWRSYREAMDRLPPRYRQTVFNIVVQEEHYMHASTAIERLQDGLDILADHYGMPR